MGEKYLATAKRSKAVCALAILDVDFFKKINDTHGHLAGDAVLIKLGSLLKKYVKRDPDIVARYGGEEFALILADTNLDGAIGVAESIRKGVEELKLVNEGSPVGGFVTMSFGVAVSDPDGESTRDNLVRTADQALYRAKRAGRNKVVS